MESSEVIIARLVLGYLKSEQCRSAYKEFFRTSNTLQRDFSIAKSRYLPTRFVGLTLEDILSEYFEIYKIVQGRLESTNYYNESHPESSLVQQLLYLLNKVYSSRTSTPCPRSPVESNLDENTPSHIDHISDVETTPAHTLPGNVRCTSEDSYLHKLPIRRKSLSKLNKATTLANIPGADKDDMSEILAQTLLENREFHEKIAENINKVAEKQHKMSAELDKTIKAVVKQTEQDPIFQQIMEEIIEITSINDKKQIETSSTTSSVARNTENFDRCKRPYYNQLNNSDQGRTDRLYSGSQTVDEQNNEAIRSIVANSYFAPQDTSHNSIESHTNKEIIVFNGSLDNYLRSNVSNVNIQTQTTQNPLYINATGSLLIPTNVTQVPTNVSGPLHVDSTNQIYILNKKHQQPKINWNIPTLKTPSIITEQDILAMPTVIVNDEEQKNNTSSKSVLQNKPKKPQQRLPSLAERPTVDIIANIEETVTLYGTQESPQNGLKKVIYPKKPSMTIETTNSCENIITSSTANASDTKKSFPSDLFNNTNEAEQPETKSRSETPTSLENNQKVTPRSGSHVRNLDFSTPPKITSTHKKTMKSNQTDKSLSFVHKSQAAKNLFNSETGDKGDSKASDLTTDSKNKTRTLVNTWDADLRASLPSNENTTNQTPRRKKKAPITKVKRKAKKSDKKVNQQLNSTAHDGALLEAALQTPVKTEEVQPAENLSKENDEKVQNEQQKSNVTANCINKTLPRNKNKNISTEKATELKQQGKETVEDNSSKMILSPSKLNANKRNLVNTDGHITDNSTLVDEKNKFITPEMTKENFHYPIKANRNISSLLETPIKQDINPKTPDLQTPGVPIVDLNMSISSSTFTPFTRMLEANLKGVDLSSLPTPIIPITPNFPPFTPNVDLMSPYSNRATDYSTSSSYYHPSDNEQNKSLEANIIELEKKPILNKTTVLKDGIKLPEGMNINEENKNLKKTTEPSTKVNSHLNIFNKGVIGKKNLNLMKRSTLSSSSSDSSTSGSSSDGDSGDSHWAEKESNDTVICKYTKPEETPKRTYSLRNRNITASNKADLNKESTCTKDVNKVVNKKPTSKEKKTNTRDTNKTLKKENKPEKIGFSDTKPSLQKPTENDISKQMVLKELEEKRLRTISKFKNREKEPLKKSIAKLPVKPAIGKFIKIKPIANLNVVTKRKSRKSDSPKKSCTRNVSTDSENILKNTCKKDTCDKDNATIPPSGKVDDLKIAEKMDKSASDVEAQNLIEGLKERGIHLMHNKSSPHKSNISFSELTLENKNVQEENKNPSKRNDSPKIDTSKTTLESEYPQLQNSELSTSELESELREIYDVQVFEGEYECVVFEETKKTPKSFEDYNTKVLKKTFIGKVFIEELNAEIDISMKFSPFHILLDIPPDEGLTVRKQKKLLQNTEVSDQVAESGAKECTQKGDKTSENLGQDSGNICGSEEITKSDDDLMNYAIVGSIREENQEVSGSSRKRKIRNEETSHTEKKCKTLLQNINVDSFLNNIHGGS